MDNLFIAAQRIAPPLLRISLGIIVLWIGALKFVDPSPVVMLLKASLPFLAFDGFVYAVGVVEVVAALALIFGIGVRYVGLLVLGLFIGTLTIFVISPTVTGFPFLNVTGQFLLKDLVLLAATNAYGDSGRFLETLENAHHDRAGQINLSKNSYTVRARGHLQKTGGVKVSKTLGSSSPNLGGSSNGPPRACPQAFRVTPDRERSSALG